MILNEKCSLHYVWVNKTNDSVLVRTSSPTVDPKRSVQGYLFNLLVMYHYPPESIGVPILAHPRFTHNYCHSLLLPFHVSIRIPLPSFHPAAREIHCGIDRKTSLVSLWTLGRMYITDQRLRSGRCVSMPVFQSLTFTRQKACLSSPLACPAGGRLRALERRKNTSVSRLISM